MHIVMICVVMSGTLGLLSLKAQLGLGSEPVALLFPLGCEKIVVLFGQVLYECDK